MIFGEGSGPSASEKPDDRGEVFLNPYQREPVPTAIALDGEKIIGHVTSTPFELWVDGSERPAHWLSGIHVLPEYRGGGIARQLAACITSATPLVTGVARVRPSMKAFVAAGWVWPGRIADHVHIVNPKRFLSQLSGEGMDRFVPSRFAPIAKPALRMLRAPLAAGIRSWQGLRRVKSHMRKASRYTVSEVRNFSHDIDALWNREKAGFTVTHVRKADYLNWQFDHRKTWGKIECRDDKTITSWAIYAVKDYQDGGLLHGLKGLNVVDALWDSSDPSSLDALLQYFLKRGCDERVDLVMFSGELPQLRRALARCAFVKLPSTIYAGFGSSNPRLDFTKLFPGSYITRGYTDAAGGLGPE